MNKLQKSILISSFLLFLVMALAAVSLAVFVPGTSREKTIITLMLGTVAPLPLILAAVFRKALTEISGQAGPFTTRDPQPGMTY